MIKQLDEIKEITKYIENISILNKVEEINEIYNNKKIIIPVMGQFSAGKSSFLNRLLGKSILPTRLSETTAFLTYIRYGTPKAIIYSKDGNFIEIDIQKMKYLNQEQLEYFKIEILKDKHFKIAYAEIYENSETLKNGIILVDTPGLNTMLDNHEDIAWSVIPEATHIIYIISKAISQKDMELISILKDMGIEIIFVRTNIDTINSDEENIHDTLEEEYLLIEKNIGKVEFYPISTTFNKLEYNSYFENFQNYFNNILNTNLDEIIRKVVFSKLNKISRTILKELDDKEKFIKNNSEMSAAEIEKVLNEVKKSISKFNKMKLCNEKEIKSKIEIFNIELKTIFQKEKEKVFKTIEKLSFEDNIFQNKDLVERKVFTIYQDMGKKLEIKISEKMNELSSEYLDDLKKEILELKSPEIELNLECLQLDMEELLKFENITHLENNYEEDIQSKLELLRNEKEIEATKLKDYESSLEEIQGGIVQYEESYVPQYDLIEGNNSISKTLGGIGAAADIALLFLPTAPIAGVGKVAKAGKIGSLFSKIKLGGNTAKKTRSLVNANKSIQLAMKAKNIAESVKGMSYKVVDTTKKIQKTKNDIAQIPGAENFLGIFDLMTLEFWFKKAGEVFDTPPRTELNMDSEIEYKRVLDDLKNQYDKKITQYMDKERNLNLIKNKEQELKRKIELQKEYEKKVKIEAENQMKRLKVQKEKELEDMNRKSFIDYMTNEIESFISTYEEMVASKFQILIGEILLTFGKEVKEKLNQLNHQLEDLHTGKKENINCFDQELKKIETYKRYLINETK